MKNYQCINSLFCYFNARNLDDLYIVEGESVDRVSFKLKKASLFYFRKNKWSLSFRTMRLHALLSRRISVKALDVLITSGVKCRKFEYLRSYFVNNDLESELKDLGFFYDFYCMANNDVDPTKRFFLKYQSNEFNNFIFYLFFKSKKSLESKLKYSDMLLNHGVTSYSEFYNLPYFLKVDNSVSEVLHKYMLENMQNNYFFVYKKKPSENAFHNRVHDFLVSLKYFLSSLSELALSAFTLRGARCLSYLSLLFADFELYRFYRHLVDMSCPENEKIFFDFNPSCTERVQKPSDLNIRKKIHHAVSDDKIFKAQTLYHNNFVKKNKASQDFYNLVYNKRIAIVGPSHSVSMSGAEIDGFDLIYRLNFIPELKGGARTKKIGSRTDIMLMNIASCNRYNRGEMSLEDDIFCVSKVSIDRGKSKKLFRNRFMLCGSPNGIQHAIYDLILHSPKKIKLFNCDLYTGDTTYDNSYVESACLLNKNLTSWEYNLGFILHDLISNFRITKFFFKKGFVSADDRLSYILSLSEDDYISILYDRFPRVI